MVSPPSTLARSRAMAADDRRARLREATRAQHEALDGTLSAAGAFERPAEYRRLIGALAAFYEKHVARLEAAPVWPAWGRWNPADPIAADADHLRCKPPLGTSVPAAIQPAPFILGILYVLVGSSLGARTLLPAARTMGFDEAGGARYLSHLAEARWAWPDYLRHLNAAELDARGEAQLVAGARFAFTQLERCVQQAWGRGDAA